MRVVPLYVMTEYSMFQSCCRIAQLVEEAHNNHFTHLAITDEGNMHGVLKFYQVCKKTNIEPIIGLKLKYRYEQEFDYLLLYAMNNSGYFNLMQLASLAKINDGFVEGEQLFAGCRDLIAIVPGAESKLFYELINRKYKKTEDLKQYFQHLYMGLSLNETETTLLESLQQAISNLNLPLIALHGARYLNPDDRELYQMLKAIKSGTLAPLPPSETDLFFFSQDDYLQRFSGCEELLQNTQKVAGLCRVEIDFSSFHMPEFASDIDSDSYLHSLCVKGLAKRLSLTKKEHLHETYYERLMHELATIKIMGYSDYFLIVWDFIKYAKNEGIYVGPGRGSAPASLVSYCLGITQIDPLDYGLLFERFLNPERITMPDIDIDFPDDARDTVIKYVGEKYGQNRVAHICTFGTFQLRSSIREVAKIVKLPETRLNELLKIIGSSDESLETILAKNARLKNLVELYPDIKQVITLASKLEGLPRNTSTHAAGIVITKDNLLYHTPLDKGMNGIYQTQYEASDLEVLGLLKMDFLSLKNLSNIKKTIDLIQNDFPGFSLPNDFRDAKTFRMLSNGLTTGVFQLESQGMRKMLIDLTVNHFSDLTLALALYRPGPLEMVPQVVARKKGKEPINYLHPDLEPILKETYGTLVYQEQILLIARKFAGYTLGQADVLRRAVAKKNRDVLEKERHPFVNAAVNRGYKKTVAEEIYDYIVRFADYGFNKAHSVAYSLVAYETAYLKANFPQYYLAVLMNSVIGSESSLEAFLKEAKQFKVQVLPPDINLSSAHFSVEKRTIRFPLNGVSGITKTKAEQILEERKNGPFKSFEDSVNRLKKILPENIIENLIFSGAFDTFGLTKKTMVEHISTIISRSEYSFMKDYDLIKPTYSDIEYPLGTLLEKEKRMLGVNLQYNLFDQFNHLYLKRRYSKIASVKTGKIVDVLGILTRLNQITTKNNEQMAFGTLKDDSGEIDVTFFPSAYKQAQLTAGMLIAIRGRIEERKGKNQLLAELINVNIGGNYESTMF
ncbi:MAG TPA: DNA polymerase III subunit alpha [Acholeplasmataceae bacterium]|nr:DNA polymerase III subunit alpha [Acholeplasmataceae bacterium]